MFRADHNHVPTSDIRHVTGENMGFALLLRKPIPAVVGSRGKKSKSGAEEDSLEHKLEQQDSARRKNADINSRPSSSRQSKGDSFNVPKDNGCRNSSCRENAQEMISVAEERINMKLYLNDLAVSVNNEMATLDTLTKEHDHFMAVQQAMIRKLSKLDVDADVIKQSIAKKKEEHRKLEEAIIVANQSIRDFRHQQDLKALQSKPKSSKPDLTQAKRLSRKHNGEYSMLYCGKLQWSCCLAEEENAMGCIDDYSVGLLSAMGRIKDSFRNYSKSQPFVPIHHDHHSLRNKQQEELKNQQRIVFGVSANEEQHPTADFHHVGSHVPMENSIATLSRPKSAMNTSNRSSSTTLRPLHQRPQSAAPGLPRHHHHHYHYHDHSLGVLSSSRAGRHRRAHGAHHHHHHHFNQQSESLDQLQSSSILSNFHNSNIGKMRLQKEGSSLLLSRNRPMSSPAGFALYKQPTQLQPQVETSVTFAEM